MWAGWRMAAVNHSYPNPHRDPGLYFCGMHFISCSFWHETPGIIHGLLLDTLYCVCRNFLWILILSVLHSLMPICYSHPGGRSTTGVWKHRQEHTLLPRKTNSVMQLLIQTQAGCLVADSMHCWTVNWYLVLIQMTGSCIKGPCICVEVAFVDKGSHFMCRGCICCV